MSNEITRFSWNGLYGMEELPDGDYVLHSDHEAEVARLRAEVERLRSAASEVADFLVCLPGMSENDVEIVASRLVERIDAAIGASA